MKKPNFIIFLTDDQGYGDLSCMGSEDFRTPNLDQLADSGALLRQWYSNSPVCSPSRASLMTGRYPGRAGVRSILGGDRKSSGLPQEVPTIATALKKLGYQTAMAGKWHLGHAAGSRPENHGFDQWFGFLSGCIDYYSHIFYWGMSGGNLDPIHDLWSDGEEIFENGKYFTEMITDKAIAYIRQAVGSENPFFLYLPFNAPHYPMHVPHEYLDRFPDLSPQRRIMAAMISSIDDSVGKIIAELERQGIRDNTCVFFQSDNGPSRESRNWLDGKRDPYYGGTTGGLKGHKFSLFEGGIKIPALISWPEMIPAHQQIDEIGVAMDIFPTFLKAAGAEADSYQLDGLNFLPVLTAGKQTPHSEIYWEMGQQTAVRSGDWKLVLNGQLVEKEERQEPVFLANLQQDQAENNNLAGDNPRLVKELKEKAAVWRQSIEREWTDKWKVKVKEEIMHD